VILSNLSLLCLVEKFGFCFSALVMFVIKLFQSLFLKLIIYGYSVFLFHASIMFDESKGGEK